MQTLREEMNKPRMWLDSGIMISIDEEFGISAIMYRRGFFARWKIVTDTTSESDISLIIKKIRASHGKSVRSAGDVVLKNESELYRNLAIKELELFLHQVKMDGFIDSIKHKYQ